MNRTKLKAYAPQARRDFIQAVTDRAAFYGLTEKNIESITENGDVAIISGRAFPRAIASKRKALEERIAQYGFGQTMDAIAYTWFNRLVAIRYMELHGYLDHGYRVLSHSDASKSIPEILEQAEHLDLPGLDEQKVIELKLEGSKEADLYRMLLLAQCNALHRSMPFLFEWIGDETELLLPENLLHTDSLIRKLVADIDEEDWQEVEIIGWLYQFYIAERKDEVMARKSAVPTEDIPAVTQLFTPHWIVRYLVENSLGRLWLMNRPGSRLREHMPYYIEGEAETDFLKITRPEDIRLLDPACGSGHMLTYAFDLLFRIYEEEGYAPNEIPAHILKHNLYGLEICPRAAQLAELALVFKAREKSRRFFQAGTLVQPRVLALQDIRFDEGELHDYTAALDLGALFNDPMLELLHQFEQATTFGSLIQPCLDEQNITFARHAIEAKDLGAQLFLRETHAKVLRALEQAEMLCQRYHVAVANPPYMGGNALGEILREFLNNYYPEGKSDLVAAFLLRVKTLTFHLAYEGCITFQNWMFISSYEDLRRIILAESPIQSLIHCGRGLWGSDFGSCAFVLQNRGGPAWVGGYFKLFDRQGEVNQNELLEARFLEIAPRPQFLVKGVDMLRVPGTPIAYWISHQLALGFEGANVSSNWQSGGRCKTHNDRKFVRFFWEITFRSFSSDGPWKAYCNGGDYRKWYGNLSNVFRWTEASRYFYSSNGGLSNSNTWGREGITWSDVTIAANSFRLKPSVSEYSSLSPTLLNKGEGCLVQLLGFLNSKVAIEMLRAINPTLHANVGDVSRLPLRTIDGISPRTEAMVTLARTDWDYFETSWDFFEQPLLRVELKATGLADSWRKWEAHLAAKITQMAELETENNRFWIEAFGLQKEMKPEVPWNDITLARPDRRKDMAAFLSYAVGCMMGRYSLDKPGLILADAGDTFENYLTKVGRPKGRLSFAPDEDGIIPVLNREWFADDIVARTDAFLRATFGEATLEANVRFIEESLGAELRKYFLSDFYKNHLSNERAYGYKKRPIYWLFSSGKERAFQCLVYLHRYHEGTLARMRTEYVIPLQGKMAARIEQLASETQKASSTSQRKTLEKERDKLLKHQTELRAFDEKLRHYADQRITLDLDDGVKVNYGKFGDLLAEVKAVTGGTDED